MPDAAREVTRERAESICEHARQFHLHFEGQSLAAVTLSLGVAIFPEHGVTSTGLLRAVDAALYRAKHEGRSRVVVAG
jgi:diguanylate cyclase (GGDEF)-like protein